MSTILRTFRNLRKIGIKEYAHQMQYMGDTKAGTYVASDRYGNKYYENLVEELPRKYRPSIHFSMISHLTPNFSADQVGGL